MTPMYVMILILTGALILLLNWTYYLNFGRWLGFIPMSPSKDSLMSQICDRHLHSRKIVNLWRNVYIVLSIFLIAQFLMMFNCAVLGDVYTQSQCIANSFLSLILAQATWFTVILHFLFLLVIDLLPASAFLFIYLPRVHSVI